MNSQQRLARMCWTQLCKDLLIQGVFGRMATLSVTPVLIEAQGPGSWLVGRSYFEPNLCLTQQSAS